LGVSYTSVHRIMNDKRPCKSNRLKERAKILDDFDHRVIKRTIQDFLPILQKMQNITIIYERNACQFRLKYTWLRERFYR
jgi:hypothetical protein